MLIICYKGTKGDKIESPGTLVFRELGKVGRPTLHHKNSFVYCILCLVSRRNTSWGKKVWAAEEKLRRRIRGKAYFSSLHFLELMITFTQYSCRQVWSWSKQQRQRNWAFPLNLFYEKTKWHNCIILLILKDKTVSPMEHPCMSCETFWKATETDTGALGAAVLQGSHQTSQPGHI